MKKNEIGWVCGTYGGQERCIQALVGIPDRVYLEDIGVDRRIIFKRIF